MRQYVAIIKDSFLEAKSSRVLWLVLGLVTLALLGLAPFHWKTSVRARLDGSDIKSVQQIASELNKGASNSATALQKEIWQAVGAETRQTLRLAATEGPPRHQFIANERLAQDFNRLIRKPDFYQPELWRDVPKSARLQRLADLRELSPEQSALRNRLALEAAFPGMLKPCPDISILFGYGPWDLDLLPALSETQAKDQIDQVVLLVFRTFVGFFGIFAAVLVTAHIIPDMLSSGALYLLLSKPISRPLLFLAKFFGGCSFVLLNVSYLVLGTVLLLWVRFGIWKPQLLWTIPLFLFSFAIFYAVSSVTGLVWRSSILAIAMTAIFWAACVTVNTTRGIMEQFVMVPEQITQVLHSGDELFIQRRNGGMGHWNADAATFDDIMVDDDARNQLLSFGPRFLQFTYLRSSGLLLALHRKWAESNIHMAIRETNWKRENPTQAPNHALALFLREETPVVVTEKAIYEVNLSQTGPPLPEINLFGLKLPTPTRSDSHTRISDVFDSVPSSALVTYSRDADRVFLQYGATLEVYSFQGERFGKSAAAGLRELDVEKIAAGHGIVGLVGSTGDTVVLQIRDGNTLEVKQTMAIKSQTRIRTLHLSDDGNWAALLADDEILTVYDLREGTPVADRIDSVSATQFDHNSLVTVDLQENVVLRELPGLNVVERYENSLTLFKKIYWYVVDPLYATFPKPSSLASTLRYALTGKDTQVVEGPGVGREGRTVRQDPWQPLWSNSAFIAVMLSFGCLYMYRHDF